MSIHVNLMIFAFLSSWQLHFFAVYLEDLVDGLRDSVALTGIIEETNQSLII